MNLRRVGIGSLAALASCLGTAVQNASPHLDSGPPPPWEGALQDIPASPAAYSIVDDEQGPYYAVVGIRGSPAGAATCSEEVSSASSQVPVGQWTLELAVPASPGQYAVLSSRGDSIYPNVGKAGSVADLVLLASNSTALQMYPVSGSVTVATGPATVEAELGGEHLTGSYHLGFAADPLQASCSYAIASFDLGDQVIGTDYVCNCATTEGDPVSSCDGGGGNFVGCCYQGGPAAIIVDGTFDASPCPGLCVAPLGLPKACHPLRGDAGG